MRPYLINDRKPSEWTGSVAILEEFMKSGGHRAVKYAQCWVYAGLVTTICRALGIPCRNVTNYISAHDTNKSMTGLVTGTILFLFRLLIQSRIGVKKWFFFTNIQSSLVWRESWDLLA